MRNLKVCRFGDNMRYVAVTEGDKVEAEINYGVEVNTWAVNDLAAVVDTVGESAVDAVIEEYLDLYDVAEELRPGKDRADSLRVAARIELGLRRFVVDGGFGAFTTNFEDLGGLRQLPGLGVQRLMAEGIGFAGEGDWKTAVLGRTLKVMAEGLPGGTSFMEDYTYDLTPGYEASLGAHMLEVCPSIAKGKPRIEVHPLFVGDREDPVRMVFDAEPGEGVIMGMCDLGDRYRWVSNELTVIDPPHPMPNLPVARAVWQVKADWDTATECWLAAGGPHHSVLTTALTTEHLIQLSEIVGTELAAITEKTTDSHEFVQRLRWTNAYHRLGMGF
jgi:L-arabinose isomerase